MWSSSSSVSSTSSSQLPPLGGFYQQQVPFPFSHQQQPPPPQIPPAPPLPPPQPHSRTELVKLMNVTSFNDWTEGDMATAFLTRMFYNVSVITVCGLPCIVETGFPVPHQGWRIQTSQGELSFLNNKLQFLNTSVSPSELVPLRIDQIGFGDPEDDFNDENDDNSGQTEDDIAVAAAFEEEMQSTCDTRDDGDEEEEEKEQPAAVVYRSSADSSSSSSSSSNSMWEPGFQWQQPAFAAAPAFAGVQF